MERKKIGFKVPDNGMINEVWFWILTELYNSLMEFCSETGRTASDVYHSAFIEYGEGVVSEEMLESYISNERNRLKRDLLARSAV